MLIVFSVRDPIDSMAKQRCGTDDVDNLDIFVSWLNENYSWIEHFISVWETISSVSLDSFDNRMITMWH